MTTVDTRDLAAVTGGIIDPKPPSWPRPDTLPLPQLPKPETIPLGPFIPKPDPSNIA